MGTQMGLKSRRKGKVGERAAAAYLRSLGFADARRTAQNRGTALSGDVECPETLPAVHFEVKYSYPRTAFDIGSARWVAACDLAREQAGVKSWALLWRPKACSEWRLTFSGLGTQVTVSGAVAIRAMLELMRRPAGRSSKSKGAKDENT